MAYDRAAQQVVMFGGRAAGPLEDTWTWDSSFFWQQCLPTVCDPVAEKSPGPRAAMGMAYQDSPSQRKVVLFGGTVLSQSDTRGDTWWWNGLSLGWTKCPVAQCSVANSPSARGSHRMEFNVAAGKTVLFGGSENGIITLDDTWLWDGTSWSPCDPCTTRPSRRCCVGFAYYPGVGIKQIVLFGGGDEMAGDDLATPASLKNDTWAWDHTTMNWTCRLCPP
jgi:hypothetical protein